MSFNLVPFMEINITNGQLTSHLSWQNLGYQPIGQQLHVGNLTTQFHTNQELITTSAQLVTNDNSLTGQTKHTFSNINVCWGIDQSPLSTNLTQFDLSLFDLDQFDLADDLNPLDQEYASQLDYEHLRQLDEQNLNQLD